VKKFFFFIYKVSVIVVIAGIGYASYNYYYTEKVYRGLEVTEKVIDATEIVANGSERIYMDEIIDVAIGLDTMGRDGAERFLLYMGASSGIRVEQFMKRKHDVLFSLLNVKLPKKYCLMFMNGIQDIGGELYKDTRVNGLEKKRKIKESQIFYPEEECSKDTAKSFSFIKQFR